MPEQLTRHPEITIEVLKSAGAACAEGASQAILRTCPAARFCKLPGGELCVYGLDDAARMTQIGTADWHAIASHPAASAPQPPTTHPAAAAGYGVLLLLAGVVIGWRLRRR